MKYSRLIAMILGLVLFFITTNCTRSIKTPSQSELENQEQQIHEMTQDWFEAERNRDLEASLSYLAPDVILQVGGAPSMKGIENARELYKGFFDLPYIDIKEYDRTVEMANSGDMAYDYGEWSLVLEQADSTVEERGKSTIIWGKRDNDNEWKAVLMSFSMNSE